MALDSCGANYHYGPNSIRMFPGSGMVWIVIEVIGGGIGGGIISIFDHQAMLEDDPVLPELVDAGWW